MKKFYPAEIALIDRSFFLTRGFFYERAEGIREEPKVVRREFEDGKILEISRPTNLGGFHLLLLEALAAEAQYAERRRKTYEKLGSRKGNKIQTNPEGGLTVDISYYKLAVCMGICLSTRLKERLDRALSDLSETSLVFRDSNGNETESCNLISVVKSGQEFGEPVLWISLCPFLASPAADSCSWINMEEVRGLKRKGTVILHGWLSSLAVPDQYLSGYVSTFLEGIIWPESPALNPSTERTRKQALLDKILPDLVNAGWKVDLDAEKERIRFKRAPLPEEAHLAMASEKCSYRVFWSDEEGGYLAICDQSPACPLPMRNRRGLCQG